ncbi:MAG: hypothetical protein JWM12_776, partial [Ilumatobacteraceae bacterium]|nr:hypothetical protein [Ilumatobacteraceae bacterium]
MTLTPTDQVRSTTTPLLQIVRASKRFGAVQAL